MLKAQVEDARVDSMAAKGRARSLQYELLASQAAAKEVRRRGGCAPHHCVEAARVKLRRFPGPADNSPSRLPLRVLNELRDILDDGNVNHFTTAAVAPRGLDFQHVLPASLSQGGEADETPAKVKRYDDTHTEKRKGKPKYVDPTDVSPCTTFFSNDSSNNFTSLAEFSDSENVPDSTFHSS
ncbi:unnamed protein product [Trypanosoma congolense IL3000]|uniref:WGS project CAEQ00000000 data, annotated contig 290 n=1 Tax=Trypanosoma congolense (strain IL3000) TaxID=1068625 RepID=F9WEM7_TRYCI|nr:unnamed protein product [Trypanosoma congolense IL3000]